VINHRGLLRRNLTESVFYCPFDDNNSYLSFVLTSLMLLLYVNYLQSILRQDVYINVNRTGQVTIFEWMVVNIRIKCIWQMTLMPRNPNVGKVPYLNELITVLILLTWITVLYNNFVSISGIYRWFRDLRLIINLCRSPLIWGEIL